jgi:glutathionylspermidine synthase
MRNSFRLLLLLLLCFVALPTYAGKDSMIEKSQLQEMFDNIRAKTKWNIDGNMVWGYFFTAENEAALEAPSKELSKMGYKVVAIYPSDDKSMFWLHVEKIETHTVQSLFQRNSELYRFASRFDEVEYDGMDVGPVQK